MTQKFEDLFTKENADQIAKYISEIFMEGNEQSSPAQSSDFDFKIQNGVFSSGEVNTWFRFDAPKDSIIKTMVQVISDDQVEVTPERMQLFDDFLSEVSTSLRTKYHSELASKIRKNLLSNISEEVMPLKTIEVKLFEMNDLPVIDYTLTIQKNSPIGYQTANVSTELMDIAAESGEDPNEIIKRKKAEGDIRYKYVDYAIKKKYIFECQLELYVDYSLIPLSAIEKSEALQGAV